MVTILRINRTKLRQWIEDIKNYAQPIELELKSMDSWLDEKKKQFIKDALKKKKVENKQYLKYLIGFAKTPQANYEEDFIRAIDTLQWFIQTNRLPKSEIEKQGWFNKGKEANELMKQKTEILNPSSKR
jgi:DNA integrity scanning protein DisA with diadenylate cyclase activity